MEEGGRGGGVVRGGLQAYAFMVFHCPFVCRVIIIIVVIFFLYFLFCVLRFFYLRVSFLYTIYLYVWTGSCLSLVFIPPFVFYFFVSLFPSIRIAYLHLPLVSLL